MRAELQKLEGRTGIFFGSYRHPGRKTKPDEDGKLHKAHCLTAITDHEGNLLCDHAWVGEFPSEITKPGKFVYGEKIKFTATVYKYIKANGGEDYGFADMSSVQRLFLKNGKKFKPMKKPSGLLADSFVSEKFELRVYDKMHQRLIYWQELLEENIFDEIFYKKDRYVILLWTGLCDVNKKKIFEGDVIESYPNKQHNSFKMVTQVVRKNGVFLLSQSKKGAKLRPDRIITPYLVFETKVSVVGNVFETTYFSDLTMKKLGKRRVTQSISSRVAQNS